MITKTCNTCARKLDCSWYDTWGEQQTSSSSCWTEFTLEEKYLQEHIENKAW